MQKEQIVNELLKNTLEPHLKEFISEYIKTLNIDEKDTDIELLRFGNCISYIQVTGFDIRDWGLFDVPTGYAHVFKNKINNQMFDLAVFDLSEVTPRYLDLNFNEQDASSIEEAIKKYIITEKVE